MKKFLLLLSFSLFFGGLYAQNIVAIFGGVVDSTGSPVSGLNITIQSDSNSGFFNYTNTVITDANGQFGDTINVPPAMTQGGFVVSFVDCDGSVQATTVYYNPGNMVLTTSFIYCAGGSGGGGSGSCSTSFIYTPTTMTLNTFFFSATNTGTAPFTYSWSMGDGTAYTSATPTHTYMQSGLFAPCLTITDATGCTANYCDSIFVQTPGSCGVSFTSSTTPNGTHFTSTVTGGTAPYAYSWDFGDNTFSTLANPTHNYTTGIFGPCLTIVDATGCTATYCDTVVVNSGGGCSAGFIFQTTAIGGTTFTSTVTGGTAPYSYSWDFGDSTFSTTANPTHVYTSSGFYTVCLTITDAAGCTSTTCQTVIIGGGSNCVAAMTATPVQGTTTVNFAGTASGGVGPYLYTWDFGDNSFGSGQNPTHTYNSIGTFQVCLTIMDTLGCTATTCNSVVVGGMGSCSANFSYQVSANGTAIFSSFPSGGGGYSYAWDFGDGTTSTVANPNHSYANGTYQVCLTITDATGCTDTYCQTIVVGSPTSCSVSYTYTQNPNGVYTFTATATGTAPYSFWWDFNDGTTAVGQSVSHTFPSTGSIYAPCVNLITGDSCVAWFCDTISTNGLGIVNGYVTTAVFAVPDAMVYLIEHDSVAGTLTAIDSMVTQQGSYYFANVPHGNYLVKAALLPSDPNYSSFLPTYYTQNLYWSGATSVAVTGANPIVNVVIDMLGGNNVTGGPGFIGGLISQGANKGGPGDPMEGVSILLFDDNLNPLTHTVSDANGQYDFPSLAYGTYYLYVEVLGRTTTHFQVILDANNPSFTNADFDVNTEDVISSVTEILAVEGIQVFPNPASKHVNLQLDLVQNAELSILLTDMTGQQIVLENKTFSTGKQIVTYNIEDLPSGVYLLNVVSDTNVASYKLVKF